MTTDVKSVGKLYYANCIMFLSCDLRLIMIIDVKVKYEYLGLVFQTNEKCFCLKSQSDNLVNNKRHVCVEKNINNDDE